jgi:hypothetical protein
MKYLILAAIPLPIALFGTLALAHGSGMMGEMTGHGMQGCMQMMHGMNGGGSQPPNEQWRRGQVGPGGEERQKPSPEPRGTSPAE